MIVLSLAASNVASTATPLQSQRQHHDVEIQALRDQVKTLQGQVEALHSRLAAPQADASTPLALARSEIAAAVRDELRLVEAERTEKHPHDLRVYWKDGIRMDSLDKAFKLKLGGRIMSDWSWAHEDDDMAMSSATHANWGHQDDGHEFRKARVYFAGAVYDEYEFKAQYDLAGGDADFKDVYVGIKHVPYVGRVRVGNFKEPFSLEELTSSKYTTFMERSLSNDAFSPGRNPGIAVQNAVFGEKKKERLTYAVGVFRQHDDSYGNADGDGEIAVTARVTALPVYRDKGKYLWHVGAAYSRRDAQSLRFRARPENHNTGRLVNTGSFQADDWQLLGLESAVVLGPFSVQGEYFEAFADRHSNTSTHTYWTTRNLNFRGYYLEASCFLTGEHRKYKNRKGAFGRVKPKTNFSLKKGGWGAWQVAARYSHLDLDDHNIRGGNEDNVTLGLNWHWNPNVRVMFNYVMASVDYNPLQAQRESGDANYGMVRVQIDF